MGILRSLYCFPDKVADLVPVDTVINAVCAAAADVHRRRMLLGEGEDVSAGGSSLGGGVEVIRRRSSRPRVFNVTSGSTQPLLWGQVESWAKLWIVEYPLENALWYPGGSFKTNRTLDQVARFFFQKVPAVLGDALLSLIHLTSSKPRVSLCRLSAKLDRATSTLEYFTTREWRWRGEETRSLLSSVRAGPDADLFDFGLEDFDWRAFLGVYMLGARRFVMHQDPSTIPQSRLRLERLRQAHLAITRWLPAVLLVLLAYWTFTVFS